MIDLAVLNIRKRFAYQLMHGLLLLHGGYEQILAQIVNAIDGANNAGGASAEELEQLYERRKCRRIAISCSPLLGSHHHVVLTRPWLSSSVTWGMVKTASRTLNLPHWRVMANMESRVMPGRMRPFNGGVISSCSGRRNSEEGS